MKSIGSCLMIGLKGEALAFEEKRLLKEEQIAGVILFERNVKSSKQVYELCKELRALTSHRPFFIGVDKEGGTVDRFSHLKEFKSYPSASKMSLKTPDQVFEIGQAMGEELRTLGVDINFAPVLDYSQKSSLLLKTRAFGREPKRVTLKSSAFCKGLKSQGILFCLKHFPGHGFVRADSHFKLPVDNRRIEDMKTQLLIFERVIKRTSAPLVMTAHIQFPNIDSKVATFSKFFLTDLLRKKMKYQGVVVSDDIDMGALKSYFPAERVEMSLRAGCDLILSCQNDKTVKDVLLFFKKNPKKLEELAPFLKTASDRLKLLKVQSPIKPWHEVAPILKYIRKSKVFV